MKNFIRLSALLAALSTIGWAGTFAFPSPGTTVVGSVGFIDADEVGFFWSVNRGDSVTENFADPLASVDTLTLNLHVLTNVLNSGAFVNWDVLLNGITVGNFTVAQGFTGDINETYSFAPIASPGNYTLRLEVTNEVAVGQGSHTFVYAGNFQHSVTFEQVIPEPGTVSLLGAGLVGLVLLRRKSRKA